MTELEHQNLVSGKEENWRPVPVNKIHLVHITMLPYWVYYFSFIYVENGASPETSNGDLCTTVRWLARARLNFLGDALKDTVQAF